MLPSTTGNRPHPSVAHKQQHHFSQDDDPRTQLAMSSVDPRVHFALVCGAKVRPLRGAVTVDVIVSRRPVLVIRDTYSVILKDRNLILKEPTILPSIKLHCC